MRLLRLELKLLLAGTAVPASVAILLLAGILALAHGGTVISRQVAALDASPERQAAEQARVFGPLDRSANAGDQLYYLFFHTVRYPSEWAPLAIGQRDVHAFNLKVRLLALQGQLYDADLGNPLLVSFGNFDLAFVIVVLAPLFVIALTYSVYAAEIETGTWSLVRSQPVQPLRVLLLRYVLRALAVWLPLLALLAGATVWLGLPIDAAWAVVVVGTAVYVALWTGVSAAVSAARQSSDFNLSVLLGVWLVWTALGPALLTVTAAARHPLPEALELTVLQRQGYHGAWDEPLPAVMEAFYQRYPQWRAVEVPRDRYSNGWYYAMQQRGDDAAHDAAARYRQALETRDAWVARLSWLCPPAAFQRLLSHVARTDLRAYLAYLDSVAAYHETLKQRFFPVIFSERTVAEVDWSATPRHRHSD